MDPFVAARQMDTDEIIPLGELRAWLEARARRDGLPGRRFERELGYRRIKNPRIWSLHDIDPKAVAGGVAATSSASASAASGGLVWKTPLGGRYYGRPSPTAEAFVKVGDVIKTGQTVALVEVMKTFNRASYGGAGLPSEARVTRILVNEGDDVNGGDAILALEVV
jgi:biotin carboxyl carrier protein